MLARGFALVRDEGGRPIRSVGDIAGDAVLDIELADGHIGAVTTPRAGAPRKTRPKAKLEQGTLF